MSIATRLHIPGMAIEYDHDINVADDFLAGYPSIASLLKDERLLHDFNIFNIIALKNKRLFHAFGLSSLLLGALSLLIAACRLALPETLVAAITILDVAGSACGALAILLVLWMRFRHYRRNWCQAVFCRERLRQWHFQKFLDGNLIDLIASDLSALQLQLDYRWAHLQQSFRDGYGLMTQFVNFAAQGDELFHKPSEYRNPAVASAVFDALLTLRFDHQLRLGHGKVEPESEGTTLSLVERTALSETIATASLLGAVAGTAASLILFILSITSVVHTNQAISRLLAGGSVLLAVVSAACRAYRTGLSLPDEPESYATYCDRIRELRAEFKTVTGDRERIRHLKHLEEECAAELRRYLRMKLRATFLM